MHPLSSLLFLLSLSLFPPQTGDETFLSASVRARISGAGERDEMGRRRGIADETTLRCASDPMELYSLHRGRAGRLRRLSARVIRRRRRHRRHRHRRRHDAHYGRIVSRARVPPPVAPLCKRKKKEKEETTAVAATAATTAAAAAAATAAVAAAAAAVPPVL